MPSESLFFLEPTSPTQTKIPTSKFRRLAFVVHCFICCDIHIWIIRILQRAWYQQTHPSCIASIAVVSILYTRLAIASWRPPTRMRRRRSSSLDSRSRSPTNTPARNSTAYNPVIRSVLSIDAGMIDASIYTTVQIVPTKRRQRLLWKYFRGLPSREF